MVIVTVQHNSSNIKSFFLLDFIENVLNTKRRKFDQKQIEVIANELGERLMHDDYLQKSKNFERLLALQEKGVRSEKLKQSLFDYFKDSEKQKYLNLGLCETLAKQPGLDLNQVLLNHLQSHQNVEQMSNYQQVRLYILLSFLKNNEPFQGMIQQLKTIVDELAEREPAKIINIIKSSNIHYSPLRRDLLMQCIKNMAQLYGQQKIQDYNFYKNLLASIERREHRKFWIEWFGQNPELLSQDSLLPFLDAFSQLEQYTLEQFLVFLNLIQQDGGAKISLKKLLYVIRADSAFITEFLRYENLFKRFCQVLQKLCEKQPDQIRLQFIYTFAQRIEGSGHRSQQFSRFLRRAYEVSKSQPDQVLPSHLEFVYSVMLINHGELPAENAKQLYEKNRERLNDIYLKSKIWSYLVSRENFEFQSLPETLQESAKILEVHNKSIREGTSFKVVSALQAVLSYPLKHISSDLEFYLKTVKEFLPQINSQQYLGLILALNPKYVKPDYQSYQPIIRELINSYPNFNKKLQFNDLVRILQKFTQINCKHPNIYNSILSDIGNNFLTMSAEERIICLESFAQMKIKQVDFFQKNIESIAQNFQLYRRYLPNILNSLYQVGYDNQESSKDILKIAEEIIHDKDINETFNLVKYLLVLKPENERELLDLYLGKLTDQDIKDYQQFKSRGEFLLVHEIINRQYKDEIFASKVGQVLDQSKVAELRANYFSKVKSLQSSLDLVTSYLKAMKVSF